MIKQPFHMTFQPLTYERERERERERDRESQSKYNRVKTTLITIFKAKTLNIYVILGVIQPFP